MRTDLGARGDPAQASSVVKALAGAGQATSPGRSIKRTLQLRETTHAFRKRWDLWLPSRSESGEGGIRDPDIVGCSRGDHPSRGGGMGRTDGQSKLGTLCGWRDAPAAGRNNA